MLQFQYHYLLCTSIFDSMQLFFLFLSPLLNHCEFITVWLSNIILIKENKKKAKNLKEKIKVIYVHIIKFNWLKKQFSKLLLYSNLFNSFLYFYPVNTLTFPDGIRKILWSYQILGFPSGISVFRLGMIIIYRYVGWTTDEKAVRHKLVFSLRLLLNSTSSNRKSMNKRK